LINGVVPENNCRFCRTRRKMQEEVIGEFQRKFRRRAVEIFTAPQQPHEITGLKALREHFQAWQNKTNP